VLPNAWDGGSTAPIAVAGARVVVMTSARMSLELAGRAAAAHWARDGRGQSDVPPPRVGRRPCQPRHRGRLRAGPSGRGGAPLRRGFRCSTPQPRPTACAPPCGAQTEGIGLPEFAGNARTDVFLFGVCDADARTPRRRARACRCLRSWLEDRDGAARWGATGPREGSVAANVIAEGR
jgi:hypothetical protein